MAWRKWRKIISQQTQSGQSVAAFCRAQGLCAPQFYEWKKKWGERDRRFVEVKTAAAAMPPAPVGAGIEVRLKNDVRVLVPPGFDANHLEALLSLLESRA